MATFLDIATLDNFSVIFVFLIVAVGGYGIMTFTKVLGQNQFVNLMTGLLFAFFVVLSPTATQVIKTIVPFTAIALLLIVMVTAASGMMGGASNEIPSGIKWVSIAIFIILLVVGSLIVVRQNVEVPERGEDFSKISTVVFHPNVIGIILLFAIAVFTVALLATKQM
jgi:hypothetical protein